MLKQLTSLVMGLMAFNVTPNTAAAANLRQDTQQDEDAMDAIMHILLGGGSPHAHCQQAFSKFQKDLGNLVVEAIQRNVPPELVLDVFERVGGYIVGDRNAPYDIKKVADGIVIDETQLCAIEPLEKIWGPYDQEWEAKRQKAKADQES